MRVSAWKTIRKRSLLYLVILFAGMYLLPLGIRPIMRPDEFRYGEIAREMTVSGDWTVPRLNGVRYFEKPALGHRINALNLLLFGENAFALRLGSALAVFLTMLAVFRFALNIRPDPLLPGTAALIYLTSGLVFGVGTFGVLDNTLTFFLTLTIASTFGAYRTERIRTAVGFLVLAGIFAGGAFLVKGFLAMAVPVMVMVPFMLWEKSWKKLLLFPWIPLAVMLAVILPWSLAIHHAEPDFWRYFTVEEHWNRFFSSTYDRKPQPFWYFVPVLLGGILPAGAVWLAGWRGVRKDWLKRPTTRFLLCWTWIPFLFYSISSCKLGTYILPCFPPLAVTTALALRRAMGREPARCRKILDGLVSLWGILWLVLAAAAAAAFLIPKLRVTLNLPAAGILILLAVWYGLTLLRKKFSSRARRGAFLLAGLVPLTVYLLLNLSPAWFGDRMTGMGISNCLKGSPVPENFVVTAGRSELAAVAWTLKRTDIIVAGRPGEFAYAFNRYPEEYAAKHVEYKHLPELIRRNPGRIICFSTVRNLKKYPFPGTPRRVTVSNGVAAAWY